LKDDVAIYAPELFYISHLILYIIEIPVIVSGKSSIENKSVRASLKYLYWNLSYLFAVLFLFFVELSTEPVVDFLIMTSFFLISLEVIVVGFFGKCSRYFC